MTNSHCQYLEYEAAKKKYEACKKKIIIKLTASQCQDFEYDPNKKIKKTDCESGPVFRVFVGKKL